MINLLRFLRLFCNLILMGLTILQPSPKPVMADVTIAVNTTTDELNNDGDCSLREAVRASITNSVVDACPAGSSSDMDIIHLAEGVYTLTIAGASEHLSLTGDLDLSGKMKLVGAGRDTTIVQGGAGWGDRIFEIFHTAPNTEVTFEKMTIQNGRPPSTENGGGINIPGSHLGADKVIVTLKEVRLQNNLVERPDGTGGGLSVSNPATVKILDSLIQNNSADRGGGVFVNAAEIQRSVFTGNQAVAGSAIGIAGEAASIENTTVSGNIGVGDTFPSKLYVIYVDGGATVTIKYSTIASNNTDSTWPGIHVYPSTPPGQVQLIGTILFENGNKNCGNQGFISNGYNLSSDDSCNLTQTSDLKNTNPLLNPLGFYGKTLPHHPPKPGSPAVTSPGSSCPAEDQLGTVRPASSCTRGAVQNALALLYLPVVTK
ncbi:CSLREA domain-containing protein [Bellilinea sp.]|uniref:CSLREA domain-containing protein n=1 Tax=Bellilinea sp. TaxID=2838785 RepID=UPI002ADD85C3|nr:CSLREA domain-containing protein [Bellilinea sp.]